MAGLKKSKIIVTGGTGFIGSKLVEKLLDLGSDVVVADIAIDPHSLFIINKHHQKAKFEIVDIRNREEIFNLFNKYKPDFVFHLAAQTLVTVAYNNPIETLESNINGTINILEAARSSDFVKTIVVASSDKAYGKSDKTYNESFPLRGDHPYDVSKSSADLICNMYYKTYNTPVVVSRFGNVYGEGDLHFDRIVPGICMSIIRNQELQIRSNGKYVRDYLYVDDVVDGYIKLVLEGSKVHGQAFNFSSGDKLSVLELVEKAAKIIGKKIDYKILNNAHNEIPYQHLNDSKVRKIGWKNNYNFEMVFKKILDWYSKIV